MENERITDMRILISVAVIASIFIPGCGSETPPATTDDTEAAVEETDTSRTVELPASEEQPTTPGDTIIGSYNLIDRAQSSVDAANERTEELEQMMEEL